MIKYFPEVEADPGVKRQVLSDSPGTDGGGLPLPRQEGAEGKLHSHPHVQSTYVESGRFAFTVGGRELRGRPRGTASSSRPMRCMAAAASSREP
jgi:quercetin dioxygenase-like cupin family protein